jgi:hypothetical protein
MIVLITKLHQHAARSKEYIAGKRDMHVINWSSHRTRQQRSEKARTERHLTATCDAARPEDVVGHCIRSIRCNAGVWA